MIAAGFSLKIMKVLAERKADISFQIIRKDAVIKALSADENPEYAHYLIAERKGKVTESMHDRQERVSIF